MVQVAQSYEVARINTREKEVEPNGHGEGTRGHELHLHELASVIFNHRIPISLLGQAIRAHCVRVISVPMFSPQWPSPRVELGY